MSNEVDAFIAKQSPLLRPKLEELRQLIKSLVPDAEELISYQVPCFKYHYMLVGFGTTKNSVSLYLMSRALAIKMKDELESLDGTVTTLHFAPDKPLPKTLIKKIVLARMHENEERKSRRKK
jgi:uncharacterized protein YdhG (YjbR/CyaY superfamily)